MPDQAFLAVQKICKEENAHIRSEFLMGLGPINNQKEYLWMQTLLADKSQKVKDIAIEKIKVWPGSPIFQEILSAASDCMEISTNNDAIGIVKNNTLRIIPDKMIVKEEWKSWYFFLQSPDKNFNDKSYLLLQNKRPRN